ncbi:MAG: release factor glutamine methyltransferase [Candidatus Peregrinibacteria bacterium Greene0416_19]|nr:MAG: release factor glutamine methyltransferase [Candidatus Peregrinibacteria bacterium Greene0416_19]
MRVAVALATSGLPPSEAEILLATLLQKDRTWLLAHAHDEMRAGQEHLFGEWVARRKTHEPVAYIIGEKDFFGRTFAVDRRVLIPRPSTEVLVEETFRLIDGGKPRMKTADAGVVIVSRMLRNAGALKTIVDVGTGSGAVAIILALERPDLAVIATDVSEDTLDVARGNARRHAVDGRLRFLGGMNLQPVASLSEPFLLVSNPPYIPAGTPLMPDVALFEPHQALFGGSDGMTVLQTLVREARDHPFCAGIVLECLRKQAARLFSSRKSEKTGRAKAP